MKIKTTWKTSKVAVATYDPKTGWTVHPKFSIREWIKSLPWLSMLWFGAWLSSFMTVVSMAATKKNGIIHLPWLGALMSIVCIGLMLVGMLVVQAVTNENKRLRVKYRLHTGKEL